MSIKTDKRLEALLADLCHELERLNDNLEQLDEAEEVSFPDEHR